MRVYDFTHFVGHNPRSHVSLSCTCTHTCGTHVAMRALQVAELEALMAGMRAREYKTDLVSKHGGSQVAIMQERNRILEEQVRMGRRGGGGLVFAGNACSSISVSWWSCLAVGSGGGGGVAYAREVRAAAQTRPGGVAWVHVCLYGCGCVRVGA